MVGRCLVGISLQQLAVGGDLGEASSPGGRACMKTASFCNAPAIMDHQTCFNTDKCHNILDNTCKL